MFLYRVSSKPSVYESTKKTSPLLKGESSVFLVFFFNINSSVCGNFAACSYAEMSGHGEKKRKEKPCNVYHDQVPTFSD